MSSHSSKKVIYAALIGNFLIAITKSAAAAYTNSSAMMSEAIHSIVDCGNQGLLLYGIKKAGKPADKAHPFGYGMELYFWTFVVAILIFAVGAGVSLYEGITKIITPHPVTDMHINYIVLGVAVIFEGGAWLIAYKEFKASQSEPSLIKSVLKSKDPTIFTVLFEDTAALLGLLAALIGLFLGELLDIPEMDGVASIVIGLILASTAILLAYETKGLLIGEAASDAVIRTVEEIISTRPEITAINEILTMHMGPQDVLLNLSLDFKDSISAAEVEKAVTEMEKKIKSRLPEIKRIFIEAQSSQIF
ncbi:MAG: cation transporter [Alphaproteobacteria bacterium]|nr:MAG: cation transporter [Alphaproteobacteria bacterium]